MTYDLTKTTISEAKRQGIEFHDGDEVIVIMWQMRARCMCKGNGNWVFMGFLDTEIPGRK